MRKRTFIFLSLFLIVGLIISVNTFRDNEDTYDEYENDCDILTEHEVLDLLIEFDKSDDLRVDKGYNFIGVDKETGYYRYSWSNPAGGSGASFSVDPKTGDVYNMGTNTSNLLRDKK